MKISKIISCVLLISIGTLMFVFAEYDDSPGGQLLGVIAVVIILIGGFRWMLSMGNEDRLATAKATITSGVIGLIIIMVSFTLVNFLINTTSSVLAEGDIL